MHNSWITYLQEALNSGLLPPEYYALGEQRSGNVEPDVLTLRTEEGTPADANVSSGRGDSGAHLIAVDEAPPRVRVSQEAAEDLVFYLQRRRTIVIRHTSGDRVVALVEIVSSANKHRRQTLEDFIDKVVIALRDGVHVLVIDPFPPGKHDPDGIHDAIWGSMLAGDWQTPQDLPLTMVSYCSRHPITAWGEPFCVGDELTEMPLFLTPERYIPLPLEATYMRAWSGVPARWQRVILAGEGNS